MEPIEKADRATGRRRRQETGKALDPNQYAIASYGPEWEKRVAGMPSLRIFAEPLQNADGSFPFMFGYDGLDKAPLS